MTLQQLIDKYNGKPCEVAGSANAKNQIDRHLVNGYNRLMVFIKGQIGYWTGKKRPDMSKYFKGKKLSEEHKKKLSKAHKGKKLSEKTKRKIGLKSLGRIVSEATKRKIGNANRGKKNGGWKGDKVKYRGLHTWIVNNWGKASMCQDCGATKNIDWHNIDGKYRRVRKDWEELCRKCHMKLDGRTKYDIR